VACPAVFETHVVAALERATATVCNRTTIPLMQNQTFVTPMAGGQLGGRDSDFVIVEWMDSGESQWDWIAPLHVHHSDDEAWYVLEGVLRVRVGDELWEAGPGSAVLAPKGAPHAYGNARRGQPARYLLVMTPKIRALVEALHEPGASDYAAIFRAHDSELLS
jgi:mannose-6-phosphate isomerase-like protein (cupin superfamily)